MRKAGSYRDQVTANGTSTQSKEIDPHWRAPPAFSGVYRIQSGSSSQHTKEGSDKGFRDRSLNVRRFPTHYLLQTHHTRASNDRQGRRCRRAQRPRRVVSILPGMRKRRKGSLAVSSSTPIRSFRARRMVPLISRRIFSLSRAALQTPNQGIIGTCV